MLLACLSTKGTDMRRRTFLRNTAVGVAALVGTGLTTMGAEGLRPNEAEDRKTPAGSSAGEHIGRPVRVVSIGFQGASTPIEKIVEHVDEEASPGLTSSFYRSYVEVSTRRARSRYMVRR